MIWSDLLAADFLHNVNIICMTNCIVNDLSREAISKASSSRPKAEGVSEVAPAAWLRFRMISGIISCLQNCYTYDDYHLYSG